MTRVLVTGGAGYIGSHTCKALAQAGHFPVTLDNLSHGHRWAVRWGPFVEADLADVKNIRKALHDHRIDAVLHFAAHAYVGESMRDPAKYFRNNISNTINLLDAMNAEGVRTIVFSSTCATYGMPETLPIGESHPQHPVNPYGESKLMVERALHWFAMAHGNRYAVLRYFNAAGADPDGEIGEDHQPETHLIPSVIEAAQGLRSAVEVYGTDYPTPDGTAIRDYVHVSDLATAHVQALDRLLQGTPSLCVNLGTGAGHSVREVIRTVESVSGRRVPIEVAPRRPGDPHELVASADAARDVLGWTPERSDLRTIIETAWCWHVTHTARRRVVELASA